MARTSYNGFTAQQRTDVARWVKTVGRPSGLVPPVGTSCEGCGADDAKVAPHNEDYSRPHTFWTLCQFCHLLLHSRFGRTADTFDAYRRRIAQGWRLPGNRLHYGTYRLIMQGRLDTLGLVRGMTVPTDVDTVLAGLSLTPIDLNVAGVRDDDFEPLAASLF